MDMFDLTVGFFLLGLVAVAIQRFLSRFLSLEGRGLRSALCSLVRSSKIPTGMREDLLVDRVLADPRIDPTSPGGKPSGAVTTVTEIGQAEFIAVLRDVVTATSPDSLVAGFKKRPDSVRVEIRKEIESLPDRVAARATEQFDRVMSGVGDSARKATAKLSTVTGVGVAIVFPLVARSQVLDGVGWGTALTMILGVFAVPMTAMIWTGILAKLQAPTAGATKASSSKSARSARRSTRSGGGGGRKASAGGEGESKGQPSSKNSSRGGSSGSSGGSQRRRGRRSSRRGGGRGGSSGGGSGEG